MSRLTASFVIASLLGIVLGFPVAAVLLGLQKVVANFGYWALYGMSAVGITLVAGVWLLRKTIARDEAYLQVMEEELRREGY